MQVLIVAGGRGLRLRPLTAECPKPLLHLGDRPILTHILDQIPVELPTTVVVSPQLAAAFQQWREELGSSRKVRIYVEPTAATRPLGPVRAVSACVDELDLRDDLLILMGDSLLSFRLESFLARATPNALQLAAYKLPDPGQASRFGVLEIGPGELVERFEEKPAQPRSAWIFTGCLYIPQRLLSSIPRDGCVGFSNAGDLISEYLRRGERIHVFRTQGVWHDIGSLESYLQAHHTLLSNGRRRALITQGNKLHGAVYVHPSARVAGSVLQDCVVMAGARVIDAHLSSCVVQPHAAVIGRTARRKLISEGSETAFVGE
ncbi:MAG: nucleotidyltransferase family protein [Actinomycetota bacterium]